MKIFLAHLLGFRAKKTDYGVIIRFPFWMNRKMKNDIIDNFRKDYEICYDKEIKYKIGTNYVRLESYKRSDDLSAQ